MAQNFYRPAWVTTSIMTEALELDIGLICEDSSTGHENKVARMALAVVAKMTMDVENSDACSLASPSKSLG
jgi:hypothetical protein